MTKETALLDYTEPPPPGYRVGRKGFSLYAQDGEHVRIVTRIASSTAEALAAAWEHYKREHDPPGMLVMEVESVVPEIDGWGFTVDNQQWSADWDETEARAAAWAWHDRRRAIVIDIDEQTGAGLDLAVMLSAALAWTDAECAEVEAYAALPFPRSIDMPAPLQRILLPQGAT